MVELSVIARLGSQLGNSINDLVWINVMGIKLIKDCKVNMNVISSDHFPVMLELLDCFENNAIEDQQ